MTGENLPTTDSIEELATFWDVHDLTDFEDQLEEVTDCVFERDGEVPCEPLKPIAGPDSQPIADG
jgi:hypothetical protein